MALSRRMMFICCCSSFSNLLVYSPMQSPVLLSTQRAFMISDFSTLSLSFYLEFSMGQALFQRSIPRNSWDGCIVSPMIIHACTSSFVFGALYQRKGINRFVLRVRRMLRASCQFRGIWFHRRTRVLNSFGLKFFFLSPFWSWLHLAVRIWQVSCRNWNFRMYFSCFLSLSSTRPMTVNLLDL